MAWKKYKDRYGMMKQIAVSATTWFSSSMWQSLSG
jgi:hypothetical protein